jgi:nitrilase
MALYGKGENVHVSVWPGNVRNTEPMMRFIAREARSYAIGVGGIMQSEDIPSDFPFREKMVKQGVIANGGTCVAGPDGEWVLPPQSGSEDLFIVELSIDQILRERHNFDAAGHYARPDVLQLLVNEERQQTIK